MSTFNHGTATAKIDVLFVDGEFSWNYFAHLPPPPPILEPGEVCIITAYLPDIETFAVSLENGAWVTFNMTEKKFKDLFYIELEVKEN
jgi:hypothetical protein